MWDHFQDAAQYVVYTIVLLVVGIFVVGAIESLFKSLAKPRSTR